MLVSLQEVNESQCIALWSYENMLSQQQYMCLENIMCTILLILLDSGVFISISECHIWSYIYMLNIKLESQYKLTCQKCDWHDLLSAVYFMLQRDTCNYTGWQFPLKNEGYNMRHIYLCKQEDQNTSLSLRQNGRDGYAKANCSKPLGFKSKLHKENQLKAKC